MTTEHQFAQIVGLLEAGFTVQPKAKHDLYFNVLGDYDFDELKVAVTRCVQEMDRYPVIKEIVERIPSFIPDDLIGNRIIEQLKIYCENHWFYVYPNVGQSSAQRFFDPDYLAILDLVGGAERLDKSFEDPVAMERLRKDYVKACSQSAVPAKTRAELRAQNLEGSQSAQIDALFVKKIEERKQVLIEARKQRELATVT